jgi:hypothetical protein
MRAIVAKHLFRIDGGRAPALDLVSYGRRGPERPQRFSQEQVAQITRTTRRTPEVMVKVSGGGTTTGKVAAHFQYISRRGELEIETDDGERHKGKEVADWLVDDWLLELDAHLDQWQFLTRGGPTAQPKLVHNIVLSMPTGTSPARLLEASRAFAREEFGVQHRYGLVLHTDQDHPHVHVVVSAHRLEGGRLNIRKADLRRWREQFASQLRRQGIAANASPAQVRGKLSNHKKDGIYRAAQRGESRVDRDRDRRSIEAVKSGSLASPESLERIRSTVATVQDDWRNTIDTLRYQGLGGLADETDRFRRSMRIEEASFLEPRSRQMELALTR